MQDQVDQKLVKRATAKYLSCLSGDIREASTLTPLFFVHPGLLDAVIGQLINGARVTLAEFHGNVQRFMFGWMLDCLERSRLGQNRLPELHEVLKQAAIYKTCLAREDGCCIYVTTQMTSLIANEIDEAESDFLQNLGTSRQELDELVLKFGQYYVRQCRTALNHKFVEDLGALGESCGLRIERVGSSEQEYGAWVRESRMVLLRKCMAYLESHDLLTLLKHREDTRTVIGLLCSVMVLYQVPDMEEYSLGWYDCPRLTTDETSLDDTDVARLQRIQLELDS